MTVRQTALSHGLPPLDLDALDALATFALAGPDGEGRPWYEREELDDLGNTVAAVADREYICALDPLTARRLIAQAQDIVDGGSGAMRGIEQAADRLRALLPRGEHE